MNAYMCVDMLTLTIPVKSRITSRTPTTDDTYHAYVMIMYAYGSVVVCSIELLLLYNNK